MPENKAEKILDSCALWLLYTILGGIAGLISNIIGVFVYIEFMIPKNTFDPGYGDIVLFLAVFGSMLFIVVGAIAGLIGAGIAKLVKGVRLLGAILGGVMIVVLFYIYVAIAG